MKARKLALMLAVAAVSVLGLSTASSASAATKTTTYPTVCSSMLCQFPLATVWQQSVEYQGVTCTLPGVTCPSVTGGRHAHSGRFAPGIVFSGLTSVAATVQHSWITPPAVQFVYNGAAGSLPDSVSFTIDRSATNQSLLDVGGTATMSVHLDDLDAGTSLTLVNERPIANQETWATDPTVSVDPSQLTMGHKYGARVVTKVTFPVGVLPNTIIRYSNFKLTATAEDTDGDDVADNTDNCDDLANADQANNDGDSQGDLCDPDDDNDGVADNDEGGCTGTTGTGDPLNDDSDGDGTLDGPDAFPCDPAESGDGDGDGTGDNGDNCPNLSNAGQANNDGDSQGDLCDPDDDNDTVPDLEEAGCAGTAGSGNPLDDDTDGDGVLDGPDAFPCDPAASADTGGGPGGGGGGGGQGTPQPGSTGSRVMLRVKCPRSAERRCRVKAVGRLAQGGPKVTNTVRRRIRPGARRTISLPIQSQFLDEARASGRVSVLRAVKVPGSKTKRKFVSRPVVP